MQPSTGMAREIETMHEFVHKPHKFALEKEKMVLRCDDGAIYEFGRAVDESETYRLVRRFQPDGELSTTKAILPAAVKQTVSDVLGENGWMK